MGNHKSTSADCEFEEEFSFERAAREVLFESVSISEFLEFIFKAGDNLGGGQSSFWAEMAGPMPLSMMGGDRGLGCSHSSKY